MNLYEFLLPEHTNTGESYKHAIHSWRKTAVRVAGGITDLGIVQGEWIEPDTGRHVIEHNRCFQVACNVETYGRLVDLAVSLFEDQQTIFTAEIGTAYPMQRQT